LIYNERESSKPANPRRRAKPSFVVLTRKTDEVRKVQLRGDRENWFKFIFSICGALILSGAGNYLFYLILKRYLE
jgi:hypothetical protein